MFTAIFACLTFLTTILCATIVTTIAAVSVPGLFSTLFSFTVSFLEWSVYLMTFTAELALAVSGVVIDIVNFMVDTYQHGSPYVARVIDNVPNLCQSFLRDLNYVRVECWNCVRHQTETVLGLWALLLATLWMYTGRAAVPNARRNNNEGNEQYDNVAIDRPHPENTETPNVGERAIPRLYPDLSAFYTRPTDTENSNPTPEHRTNNNSSSSTHRDNSEESLCVVCWIRHRGVAVFPCGHTHMCLACTRDVIRAKGRCPICQTDIEEYRVIYL